MMWRWLQVACILWVLLCAGRSEARPVERNSFVIHELGWAPVIVLDMVMPMPRVGFSGECLVRIALNQEQAVEGNLIRCDEGFEANTMRAVGAWRIESGRLEFKGQETAFRARFVFNDRSVELHLNHQWIESPVEGLPPGVRTSRLVVDRTAVPKYPKPLLGSGEQATCILFVEIGKSGRPIEIKPTECSELFAASASRAAKRWRWQPPLVDGERVSADATIRMRFKAQ